MRFGKIYSSQAGSLWHLSRQRFAAGFDDVQDATENFLRLFRLRLAGIVTLVLQLNLARRQHRTATFDGGFEGVGDLFASFEATAVG